MSKKIRRAWVLRSFRFGRGTFISIQKRHVHFDSEEARCLRPFRFRRGTVLACILIQKSCLGRYIVTYLGVSASEYGKNLLREDSRQFGRRSA